MDFSEVTEEDGYDGLDIPRPRDGWVYDDEKGWAHCGRSAWLSDDGAECCKCRASFSWDDDE